MHKTFEIKTCLEPRNRRENHKERCDSRVSGKQEKGICVNEIALLNIDRTLTLLVVVGTERNEINHCH